ncbi:FxsA family protein, partial [candidate division KSB1 bacterium]
WILIEIGKEIGSLATVLLIIFTGAAGAYLTKLHGLITIYKIRENLSNGIMPSEELLDGVLILFAGGFLITPGLLTDTVGFLLLFPKSRNYIKRYLKNKFISLVNSKSVHIEFSDDFYNEV